MELLQLRYFLTTASLEHVSQAAKVLSISQPSLSKTIRTLEKELGVDLFERQGKYIRVNAAGRVFLNKVNAALNTLDEGIQLIKQTNDRRSRQISLAFLAASPFLPELIGSFRALHPGVEFNLLQHIDKTSNPQFDLCISSLPPELDNIRTVSILTEEIFLAVPNNHHLALYGEISLRDAANEKFINLKTNHAFRRITDDFCSAAGFTPKVVFESDDAATVRGLINAGLGIGFIPAVSWKSTIDTSVKKIRIREPVCSRSILLSWPEKEDPSDLVSQFKDFTIEFFKNIKC
jgi:DNA-binding transcriptional LysR family regulator